jgi:hypothetical protein
MSSNAVDSPHVSDNESTNPYDVLRDDEDDEVPTDADEDGVLTDIEQKESEDDSISNNSARLSDPSESEYESATDTMTLVGKKKKSVNSTSNTPLMDPQTHVSLESYATPDSNPKTPSRSTNPMAMEQSSPDSKPRAKTNPTMGQNSSNQDAIDSHNLENPPTKDAPRRLFDNRKLPPMTADEISPSVLDDLLYSARQYDTTLIATSEVLTQASSQSGLNNEVGQEKNTNPVPTLQHGFRPAPIPPQEGRGRGGRFPQQGYPNQPRPGTLHPSVAHQQTQGTTATGNQVQNMDTDNSAPARGTSGTRLFLHLANLLTSVSTITVTKEIFLMYLAH